MCSSSSPRGDDEASDAPSSSLQRWEHRLATPRTIAMERMRHLGVPLDPPDRPSRDADESDGDHTGGLPAVLVALLEESSCSCATVFASVNGEASPSGRVICDSGEVKGLHRTVALLSRATRFDPTLGEEIARAGSQPICKRFIQQIHHCRASIGEDHLSEVDSDALIDLQDGIFEVYSPSSAQGMAFTDDELRRRLPLVYHLTPVPQCIGTDEDEDPNGDRTTIFIRQVTKRQSAQADVGFVMWPSAIVLARWVASHPRIVEGKSVLELGAGCGLVGIAAARIKRMKDRGTTQEVIITDVNEIVLENLAQNIELNDAANVASVAKLDFYAQTGEDSGKWIAGELNGTAESHREPVDVILAADVICQPDDAIAASKTILDALRPGGAAYVVCANAEHRFGVEIFAGECERRGLVVTATDVADMYDGELLSEQMDSAAGYVDGMELTFFEVIKR